VFDRRNQSGTDPRHVDALAGIGGCRDELGGTTRHTGEVAGAWECHQDRPFPQITPQGKPAQIAGDRVKIRMRTGYGLVNGQLPCIR
jgi:hypothetical protein